MKRTFLRQALVILATCALYLPIALYQAIPAQAATFTFTDSNCSSFSFDAGTGTLSCVISGPPACTISGPSSGVLGSPITLTANCSPAATSWAWTGNVSACSSSTCQDTQIVPGNVVYTVTGTNANGTGGASPNFQVNWSAQAQAPTGCTISGAPSGSKPQGYQATLTVNCTGGGAPTSYSWTGAGAAGQTTNPITTSPLNATTTFTATPCSTPSTCMTTPGVTVTIGGGGGGGIDCSVQGYPSTKVIDVSWPADGTLHSIFPQDYGGMGPNDALVLRFTTSAVGTPATSVGRIDAIEYGSPPSNRVGSLSSVPCDFAGGLVEYHCGGTTTAFGNIAGPTVLFNMNKDSNCKAKLLPSTTYYFNLVNQPGSISCASTGVCDLLFHFQKPGGT